MNRRNFLTGTAALAAAGFSGLARAMDPDEQAAHDRHAATKVTRPSRLIDSAPVLQVPSDTSVGVAFAVTAFSLGFAEVADNPEMTGAVRFTSEGMPFAKLSSRVQAVRMTGLKPATRYYYRVGAAAVANSVGYWIKASDCEWSEVYSFVTPGAKAESRFAVITDTHCHWRTMDGIFAKLRTYGAPVTVWLGDVPPSKVDTEEEAVTCFLKPKVANPAYATMAPILFQNGNHDARGTWNRTHATDVMMARPLAERGEKYAALIRNFAIRQGDIAMIGLDTGEDKPDRHPCFAGAASFEPYRRLQAEWLKEQFCRPEIANAPYVVAFCHIPLYDSNPNANAGDVLENWADWRRDCAELWGPTLDRYGVQAVIVGHKHYYRCDPPGKGRCWTQIAGGGPGDGSVRGGRARFPTVIGGEAKDGKLTVTVWNTLDGSAVGTHEFNARK